MKKKLEHSAFLYFKKIILFPRLTCGILSFTFQLETTENGDCFKVYTIIKVLEVKDIAFHKRLSLDSSDRKK